LRLRFIGSLDAGAVITSNRQIHTGGSEDLVEQFALGTAHRLAGKFP
jgi:hypothetical protein